LKEKLEILAERLRDSDFEQRKYALDEIEKEVKSATTSMTSVPKPLKFMISHYPALKEFIGT